MKILTNDAGTTTIVQFDFRNGFSFSLTKRREDGKMKVVGTHFPTSCPDDTTDVGGDMSDDMITIVMLHVSRLHPSQIR